jgi:hypothetical protein
MAPSSSPQLAPPLALSLRSRPWFLSALSLFLVGRTEKRGAMVFEVLWVMTLLLVLELFAEAFLVRLLLSSFESDRVSTGFSKSFSLSSSIITTDPGGGAHTFADCLGTGRSVGASLSFADRLRLPWLEDKVEFDIPLSLGSAFSFVSFPRNANIIYHTRLL